LIPQRFQRSMVHVTSPTSLAIDVPQGRKLFVFDRVFPESTDQEGVWEYLSDSVSSFLQGYNVSILAYGQSGAGKSYTMGTSGPGEQNDNRAMGKAGLKIVRVTISDCFFFYRNHSTRRAAPV
jgi:Kinesin motor domain